jgi:probable blue pigment (indigoidine) exporter
MKSEKGKFIALGILFSALWASASVGAKFGLRSAEPLVLFQARFFLAGILMLFFAYAIQRSRLPTKTEWIQLSIFGFLNVTLYLTFFVLGINEVAAGIGSLSLALNPLIMSILSAFVLGRTIQRNEFIALFLGCLGVSISVYPLLQNSFATPVGLVYLFLSMVAYSVGSIYYSKIKWQLARTTINGWQVFLGGIFMLPLTFLLHKKESNFDLNFLLSTIWLAVPVSIGAVSLWLWLLKGDAVKSSLFLFLSPIFGFIFATLLLNEPFTIFTFTGLITVLIALYVGQKKHKL